MFPQSIVWRRMGNVSGKWGQRSMGERETQGFYTLKGYSQRSDRVITESMEDYLEMICRCALEDGYVRIHQLADRLNVKPSSASKMAGNLRALDLVEFERYGLIRPSERGWRLGKYLLYRHDVLHRFFCMVNHSENELQQVEQIEHYINQNTVENLEKLLYKMEALQQTESSESTETRDFHRGDEDKSV